LYFYTSLDWYEPRVFLYFNWKNLWDITGIIGESFRACSVICLLQFVEFLGADKPEAVPALPGG
jgi:hypothetical protein